MPRRLGQHFLTDPRYQQRIVDALGLTGQETVIEIGAGRGALTRWLAERAARVIAIELDPSLAAELRSQFAANPRVEIVEGDILQVPLPEGKARVFGNLPYYITSPILLRLFANASRFDQIVVMVQKEVAERLVARPGTKVYGLLSVTTQYYTHPALLFTIPPGAFRPPPKVDSALVRMEVSPRGPGGEKFFAFVRAAFSQKRKTLVNNLKARYGVEGVRRAMESGRIPVGARAEQLSLEQFQALFLLLAALG